MRLCIFADDLTGANGLASLLKREGLPTHTHLLIAMSDHSPAALARPGAHVLDLETRDLSGAEAVARLAVAAGWLGPRPDLIGLRIDSTLRGPIPESLDAVLADRGRLALVVPAFPASGRTTRDGIHLVHGVPLAQTEVAHDPQCPVSTSNLAEWIGGRMRHASATLDLATVRRGADAIAARLVIYVRHGARAVFCDAETDRDIGAIARGALALQRRHGVAVLPVDPGPFTAAVAHALCAPQHLAPLLFGVVGSVMETSRTQMDFVETGNYAFVLRYDGQSAGAMLDALARAPVDTRAMLVRTDTATLDMHGRSCLFETLAAVFEGAIARFPSLRGFLLSGGETAGRLLARCGVRSLRMQGEIMPLIALSRIADGSLAGRYLVTKGGTVGTVSAIVDGLGRLYDALADDP